jgi:Protein of unknown function (DUF2917)
MASTRQMREKEAMMQLLLEPSELLDLGKNLQAVDISCQAGCCWLTQAGDSRDHILRAGQSHTIRLPGKVLVTATETTRLQLTGERKRSTHNSPWRQFCTSLPRH